MKRLILLFVVTILGAAIISSHASAYAPYCTSAACRAAADEVSAKAAEAATAKVKADDAATRIAAKESEIAQKEAEIRENEAMRADIQSQIKDTEAELKRDKKAIRTLIIKTSQSQDNNSGAIDILASAGSVSDVVEEDNRQESVEEQLTKAAKQVQETKNKLEQQKAAIQATIDDNNTKKQEISNARSAIAAEKAGYDGDAAAAAEAQQKAQATMDSEIAAARKAAEEARRYLSGGTAAKISAGYGATGWWGVNTYPYSNICPGQNTKFYFHGAGCQCTSYAGWKAQEKWGVNIISWGNAKLWGSSAANRGYRVDHEPAPYTIGYTTSGTYGHVTWIESVSADGNYVNLTEYNFNLVGDFGARQNVPVSKFSGFIHFN